MAAFLSAEWLAAWQQGWAGAMAAPGPDAAVAFVVTGVKEGADGYWWKLKDGLLVDAGLGPNEEADVTFTLSYKDAIGLARGESDLNAGFMSGRTKVAGDSAQVFSVLALTASPAYKAMVSELAGQTEFGA